MRRIFSVASAAARALPRAQISRNVIRRTVAAASRLPLTARPMSTQPDMFCYQCEQTEQHKGCTKVGNCGKTPDVAAMQDLLIYDLKGISFYAHRLRQLGIVDDKADHFLLEGMFSTLTNVNFDATRFVEYLKQSEALKSSLKARYVDACKQAAKTPDNPPSGVATFGAMPHPALWRPAKMDAAALVEEGKGVGLLNRKGSMDETVLGLQELIVYGLKGLCAYAHHALMLQKSDASVYGFVFEALDFLSSKDNTSVDKLLSYAMRVGEVNLRVMQILEEGHTSHFGHPTPTQVSQDAVAGKCILVSGHDMADLEAVLKQTEGKGINVYTHGELLPAHGYPALRKYSHLVANYGGAWQMQRMEFGAFPGPIVMTTNCLQEPRQSYRDRIFTSGAVGWEGVPHIANRDFSGVIDKASKCEGFKSPKTGSAKLTVGFGRETVLGAAGAVIGAAQKGALKRIVLIGGCDGSEGERNYYKQLALSLPQETIILTLGCGKYRFNKLDFGMLPDGSLPRLLDMGQCNDSYAAIQVAVALANALKTDVNSLPLSLALSWFEQKAVAVLLTLLHLGVRNIRVGPALPAFLTPASLGVLVDKFALKPVDVANVQADVAKIMAGQ